MALGIGDGGMRRWLQTASLCRFSRLTSSQRLLEYGGDTSPPHKPTREWLRFGVKQINSKAGCHAEMVSGGMWTVSGRIGRWGRCTSGIRFNRLTSSHHLLKSIEETPSQPLPCWSLACTGQRRRWGCWNLQSFVWLLPGSKQILTSTQVTTKSLPLLSSPS